MSVRSQIVAAMSARMATILSSGGFGTDFGQYVEIWKSIPLAFDGQILNIRDVSDPGSDESLSGSFNSEMHYLIVEIDLIAANKGSAAPAYIGAGISDVYKVIQPDDKFGIPEVVRTQRVKDEFLIDQAERIAAGATITLRIQYRTKLWEN